MFKQFLILTVWVISSIICIPIQEYTLKTDNSKNLSTIFYAFFRNILIFTPLVLSFMFPSRYLICLSITSVFMLITSLGISTLTERIISFFSEKLADDIPDFVYWFFIVLSTYTGFYMGKSEQTCQSITNYSLYIIITILILIIIFLIFKKTNERKQQVKLHQQYLNKEDKEIRDENENIYF
jgi:hypothetical protein